MRSYWDKSHRHVNTKVGYIPYFSSTPAAGVVGKGMEHLNFLIIQVVAISAAIWAMVYVTWQAKRTSDQLDRYVMDLRYAAQCLHYAAAANRMSDPSEEVEPREGLGCVEAEPNL